MANRDMPAGAKPNGLVLNQAAKVAGGTVYPGDFVRMDNTGRVVAVAAGETILGVCLTYGAAGDSVMVSDSPEQQYLIQATAAEVDAQTDIGNNADVLATAGNSTYRQSRMELDSSTLATSSAQLTILDIQRRPDSAFGANVTCVVRINEHQIQGVNAFAGI